MPPSCLSFFFFFNDTATTEIYTLSLHDALPISHPQIRRNHGKRGNVQPIDTALEARETCLEAPVLDRKSTRLNSSHSQISYAVFCLKKKKKHNIRCQRRKPNLLSLARLMHIQPA